MSDKRILPAVQFLLAAFLLFAGYTVVRELAAELYVRRNTTEGYRSAQRWDPANPLYPALLAQSLQNQLSQLSPEEVVRLYEAAVRMSPSQAAYWAQLGSAYEWVGRSNDALHAFERARELFPNSPAINWQLGNFYVRAERWPEALQTFQKSLVSEELRPAAFDLAWRGGQSNRLILETMIPARADVLLDYLRFLNRTERTDAAIEAFSHLLASRMAFEPEQVFSYFELLIKAKRTDELKSSWAALAERFPTKIRLRSFETNALTNSDFEVDMLNGGLGWRIAPVESVTVRLDSLIYFDGTASLQIEFGGKDNLNYYHVFQYVVVQPGKLYQFTGYMRTRDITSDSGPRFEIYDAYNQGRLFLSTAGLISTNSWAQQQIVFKTPPETRLLVLRVARPRSQKFDNKLSGTVWVDRLVLALAD